VEVIFVQFTVRFWNFPADGEQEIKEMPQRWQAAPRVKYGHKLLLTYKISA